MRKYKIVISLNTSWNIYNFRLNLARALKNTGYDVVLVAPYDVYSEKLKDEFTYYDIYMNNKGTNPNYIISYILWKKNYKYWSLLVIFILLNPITLILYQTPRQFLAVTFFIIYLFSEKKIIQILLLVVILLTHNITGLFVITYHFLRNVPAKYYPLLFFFVFVIVYYFGNNHYAQYFMKYNIERGRGRLILFMLYLFIFIIFLFYKKNNIKYLLLYFGIFSSFFYFISPYFSRVFSILLPAILIYMFLLTKKNYNLLIIVLINTLLLFFSFYILFFGLYNY